MKEYKAGIYLRLSKEDKEKNNSIDMQREITTAYANKHNYNIVQEYVDNGYSGILSSRPNLNRLMIDIVRKKINMVIVKDMSRLTRDKNMTSYYTDIFFPDNDVRLISVTEYVDSGERYEIDDAVALRGIVNQSYLEDISRKIKATKYNMKKQGKFIEDSVAYGYKKDENDKQKIVIDEKVSSIVQFIFEKYIETQKPLQIANILNNKKIQTPSQYFNLKRQASYWTKSIINRILSNPIYIGAMVLNKYNTDLKTKKKSTTRKSEYELIENTHEAIIPKEMYGKVQMLKGNRKKEDNKIYLHLLKGLVYCEHCGRKMTYKNSSPVYFQNGKVSGKQNDKGYYICTEHYRHIEICDKFNKIMENDLKKIVLSELSKRIKEYKLKKYSKEIQSKVEKQNPELIAYKKIKNEINKKESDFKFMYSKKVEGIISEDDFIIQYNEYQNQINNLKKELDRLEKNKININFEKPILNAIISFEDVNNIDNITLKKLIEKIYIGENQKVKICFKV